MNSIAESTSLIAKRPGFYPVKFSGGKGDMRLNRAHVSAMTEAGVLVLSVRLDLGVVGAFPFKRCAMTWGLGLAS